MPWHITDWAMNAMYRRLIRVLSRQEPVVLGQCKCCGRCCKEIVLYVGKGWLRSRRQFERAKAKDPDLQRFTPMSKDEAGRIVFRCELLGEDNLCGDYENRLPLCRNHPNKDLYYSGVVLGPQCGYKLRGPRLKELIKRLLGRKPTDFGVVLERAQQQNSAHSNNKTRTDDS